MTCRRTFVAVAAIALFNVLLAAPGAWAQEPGKVYRLAIGAGSNFPSELNESSTNPRWAAFFTELRRLGWIERQNLQIARWRFADRPRDELWVPNIRSERRNDVVRPDFLRLGSLLGEALGWLCRANTRWRSAG